MRFPLMAVIAFVAASNSGCRDAPTDPVATLPVEIRAFLRTDSSLVVRSGALVLDDRRADVVVFRVAYGEPQDCQSGCFYAAAIGVRAGDRTGWMEGIGRPPTSAIFRLQPQDSSRFTPAFVDELKARDVNAFFAVAFALACSPNVTVSLRDKLLRENPSLPVPILCPK